MEEFEEQVNQSRVTEDRVMGMTVFEKGMVQVCDLIPYSSSEAHCGTQVASSQKD